MSYFLYVMAFNIFSAFYNYLDFRFHWTPLEKSYLFAAHNVSMALVGGLGIRSLVPERLSEEHGALFGISVQVGFVLLPCDPITPAPTRRCL